MDEDQIDAVFRMQSKLDALTTIVIKGALIHDYLAEKLKDAEDHREVTLSVKDRAVLEVRLTDFNSGIQSLIREQGQ